VRWAPAKPEGELAQTVTGKELRNYLLGDASIVRTPGRAPGTERETRVGLERDEANRRPVEGHFYSKEVTRPDWRWDRAVSKLSDQATRLVVGIRRKDGKPLEELKGTVGRLGGEGYLGRWTEAPGGTTPDAELPIPDGWLKDTTYFQLALLTPGVFRNGWLPDTFVEDEDEWFLCERLENGKPEGDRLAKLLGVLTDRPVPVGGWDRDGGRPKRMYQGAAPGTVYFFERWTDDAAKIEALHGKALPCRLKDGRYYEALGYGRAVVGRSIG
jgi:CRISPR type III-B/RAMP module-associated protein Cmr3